MTKHSHVQFISERLRVQLSDREWCEERVDVSTRNRKEEEKGEKKRNIERMEWRGNDNNFLLIALFSNFIHLARPVPYSPPLPPPPPNV